MMSTSFYITTPIYYVNAEPHLGHAYTTIVADVASRFHAQMGFDVRFQTGTDEHGDKIARAAHERGVEPRAYADSVSQMFRDLWPELQIRHDRFVRTTDSAHVETVRKILQRVYESGDIYFAQYGGRYCVGCERFYTDRELIDGKCPDHQTEPDYIEEENYFFKMSAYQSALIEHIESNPGFIRPERYRNEVLSFLKDPLEDLCISRPKKRLSWGIELPFDENYVTYVWFDALINYLTGLGWPDGDDLARFWPAAQHLIAKDILKPHGIYWPTMLMAAGIPLFRHLNVHGYWNVEDAKMSKSLGNAVAPLELARVHGVDAFRYFMLREMSFGLDASFSEKHLVDRYNSDLANDLGNLFSRVTNMIHRYRDGAVPPQADDEADRDDVLRDLGVEVLEAYGENMARFAFHKALAELWRLIRGANKYIVESEPWVLAKSPERASRLDAVLNNLVEALARIALMISPVMPEKAEEMARSIGAGGLIDRSPLDAPHPLVTPGAETTKVKALFPRVDKKKERPRPPPTTKPGSESVGETSEVTIEEFGRLELRVGTITSCSPVEGADRLLRLDVDLGEGEPRTIVAGIARHEDPQELLGRQVVVVANLKPAKLRGVRSHGMLLAASDGEGTLSLITPASTMVPGSKVK